MDISLKSIAHTLGGELRGNQVLAPGPGHSREDRSLSITINASGNDVVVHSFAHDDPITCKDYVREKCGIEFKPNGKQRFSEDHIMRAVMAAAEARAPDRNWSRHTPTPTQTASCYTKFCAMNQNAFSTASLMAMADGFTRDRKSVFFTGYPS